MRARRARPPGRRRERTAARRGADPARAGQRARAGRGVLAALLGLPLATAERYPRRAGAARAARAAIPAPGPRAAASRPSDGRAGAGGGRPARSVHPRRRRRARPAWPVRLRGRACRSSSRRRSTGSIPSRATARRRASGAAAARRCEEDAERLKDLASEAPVIRLVNQLIARAVETQASDIHIEPFEDRLRRALPL